MEALKKPEDFFTAIQKAIANGLDPAKALDALTRIPAQLIGMSSELGSIEVGKRASFLITSGPAFEEGTTLFENWVEGKPYVLQAADEPDLDGKYDLQVGPESFRMEVRGGVKKNTYHLNTMMLSKVCWMNMCALL